MDLFSRGTRRLLGAIRSGNPPLALVGATLAAIGLMRRWNSPREELVYTTTVRAGERVEIAVVAPDPQRTR